MITGAGFIPGTIYWCGSPKALEEKDEKILPEYTLVNSNTNNKKHPAILKLELNFLIRFFILFAFESVLLTGWFLFCNTVLLSVLYLSYLDWYLLVTRRLPLPAFPATGN